MLKELGKIGEEAATEIQSRKKSNIERPTRVNAN